MALSFAFLSLMSVCCFPTRKAHSFKFNAKIGLKYTSSKIDLSLPFRGIRASLESCIFSKSSLGRRLLFSLVFSLPSKVRLRGPESLVVRLVFLLTGCGVLFLQRTWGNSLFVVEPFTRSSLISSSEDSAKSAVSDSSCLFAWFAYLLTDKVRCPGDVWRLVEWISANGFTDPRVSSEFFSLSFSLFTPGRQACEWIASLRLATKALGWLRLRFGLLEAFPAKSKL